MKRTIWAAMAAAAVTLSIPVRADDTPPSGAGGENQHETSAATTAATTEEIRAGAGSMEPAEKETDEERVEREFVSTVWNSP